MAKGDVAKEQIIKKLKEVFGTDFCGVADKKVYIYAGQGPDRCQIAINMTAPKTEVDFGGKTETTTPSGDWDWSNPGPTTAEPRKPAEVTDEEKENLRKLMEKFNLI